MNKLQGLLEGGKWIDIDGIYYMGNTEYAFIGVDQFIILIHRLV